MILEIAIAVVGGIGLASAIVSRMDKQDERRHPDGWQPRSEFDDHGGSVGQCPLCMANRENTITGRNARPWEAEADARAEYLAQGEHARQPAYQRAEEPTRYNAQREREVEMWQPPTVQEFNAWANQAWHDIQNIPHGNTPDAAYYGGPMETEQPDITSGIPQRQLEARNNDGSTELPTNFTGSVGNFAHASLRQARADAGGVWVRVAGQDVWVED
jgi:hypothetical protein